MKGRGIVYRKHSEVPEGARRVAEKRVRPFIAFYGQFIDTVSLPLLAESLYLQGVEDGMLAAIREMDKPAPPLPLNYEI